MKYYVISMTIYKNDTIIDCYTKTKIYKKKSDVLQAVYKEIFYFENINGWHSINEMAVGNNQTHEKIEWAIHECEMNKDDKKEVKKND